MDFDTLLQTLPLALGVFALRVINNAVGTIRVVFIARQQIFVSTILAIFESLAFAVTISSVVSDLTNPLVLSAYCIGFAVGSWLGLRLERYFFRSFMSVHVVAQQLGHEIAVALREAGFAATESTGEGRDGAVKMLRIVVDRKSLPIVLQTIRAVNERAFISVDETRAIEHGYIATPTPSGRRLRLWRS